MRPTPVTRPSAGLRVSRSSSPRRRRCAATVERPVLDEGAGIDEIVDVLAHRALLGLAAAGGRPPGASRPGSGRGDRASRPDRGGCDRGRRPRPRRRPRRCPPPARAATAVGPSQMVSPGATCSGAHDAGRFRRDDVLHLHRFHHRELRAAANGGAVLDGERDDRALQRRPDGQHAVGQFRLGAARWPGVSRLPRLAVGQHGQRIDGIDLGAGSGRALAAAAVSK